MSQDNSKELGNLQVEVMQAILSEMTDGVALFDEQQNFVWCNEQYHDLFSQTREVRIPGTHLRDILAVAAARKEQVGIPDDTEEWINTVAEGMKKGGEEEVKLWDGRSVHIRRRVVPGLGAISVISDITARCQQETKLAAMAKTLQVQATIDPLTQVYNRRVFDQILSQQLDHTKRSSDKVSLILLDVDFFKNYNDHYGHVEGDTCLKLVAKTLSGSLQRKTDVIARFGGEEFCVLLPGTDEADATTIAERLRKTIEDLNLSHEKSEFGHLSVSCGIADCGEDGHCLTPSDLIKRADLALYAAKLGGRNRVMQFEQVSDQTPTISDHKESLLSQTR